MIDRAATCPVCLSEDTKPLYQTLDRSASPPAVWRLRRCLKCRIGWTDPIPTESQIRNAYPPHYLGDTEKTLDEFDSGRLLRSRSWKNETEKVTLVEGYIRSGAILDVGCGDGKFLWALDSNRWRRHGVEVQSDVVRMVSSRMPELELTAGDIWAERLADSRFDAVTLWHVLEHLPDPAKTIGRLHQMLRSGGYLFVAVPNLDSLQARLFKSRWLGLDTPRHLFHYSPTTLRRLLEGAGFRILSLPPFASRANFHHMKYSLINWCQDRFGGRLPYYFLKWTLLPLLWSERLSRRWGMLTVVAQKEPRG